ncbi:hypothetical protein J7E38_02250 [Bacillus sp. ISL-35]|uniref:hypothetical protein n=1 Tax=Bacillus sp. ISL-35 TaxID=2819122 RepID=UPI001BE9EC50|nr:hypothetical protein [Bacillus sp. ISL-35]MBT2677802.1 hypothetical protein [Bacillus sp. ISL-35]MBT2705061.1 hypothetical protein [Chryseobacterium sp. ISL-80]
MFDPTAFENIKVVIEGEIYDRDLSGEIKVVDRNDWINTAKLSRKYEISFTVSGYNDKEIAAIMTLEAGLENLSAELLGSRSANHLAGCIVGISFTMLHRNEVQVYRSIQEGLEDIWGKDREIVQSVQVFPLAESQRIRNFARVSFNRLVYEEQIDDLTEMIDYMVDSVNKLKKLLDE